MKYANIPAIMSSTIKALIAEAETVCDTDPDMREAAAMVYVGDIYALREDLKVVNDDCWGTRCYTCPPGRDPL